MGLKDRGKEKERNKITRKRKRIILLSTEGDNKTEILYFSNFKNNKLFNIRFVKCNDTDPIKMVNSITREFTKLSLEEDDLSFCLIDMDTDPNKQIYIDKALTEARRQNANILISNPCFEIWYLCHYFSSTKSYISNSQVLNELKRHIPNYEKCQDIFNQISSKTGTAIENAKKLEQHHNDVGNKKDTLGCNPSTNVYKIVDLLINKLI